MGGGYLESVRVDEIFDDAFCKVTKKLVNLELQKVVNDDKSEEEVLLQKGYREKIEIYGFINSKIVCQFSDELYRYITDTMNNGVTPSDEEIHLFLNEYINIACGYAVSKINNLVGKPSRLSVPRFYQQDEPLEEEIETTESGKFLTYHTAIGRLHIYLCYSLQTEQEEGK
jgi:chemotaxis protein CheY-P-specific phosphatase CheC